MRTKFVQQKSIETTLLELIADLPLSVPLDEDTLAAISATGLLGCLAARLDELDVTSDVREQIAVAQLQKEAWSAKMANYLAEAVEVFDQWGVFVGVIKGAATARYYPDPSIRTFGDIDLVVGLDSGGLLGPLLDLGATPRIAKAASEISRGKPSISEFSIGSHSPLDLHFSPYAQWNRLRKPEVLLEHFRPVELPCGITAAAPTPELDLVISLTHLMRDRGSSLAAARDAVEILRNGMPNKDEVGRIAEAEGLSAVVSGGMQLLSNSGAIQMLKKRPGQHHPAWDHVIPGRPASIDQLTSGFFQHSTSGFRLETAKSLARWIVPPPRIANLLRPEETGAYHRTLRALLLERLHR